MTDLDVSNDTADERIAQELQKNPFNVLIRTAYRYSRASLELFFYNEEFSDLFFNELPTLLRKKYQTSEKRRSRKPRN